MQLSVLHVSAVTELYRNPAVRVKVGEMGALRDGLLIRDDLSFDHTSAEVWW